jgi:glycosyltransferase involved in cell wall biosynthesis
MSNIKLSYTISTYNKLSYLKETLPRLIANKKSDEEIIIVDGGSSDGTIDYLNELYKDRKIDFFISEKDAGEAHGTNKSWLNAQGDLIKVVSDDDAFDWEAIQKCKEFMLAHKEFDILGTNGVGVSYLRRKISNVFRTSNYENEYERWLKDKKIFSFCGLGWMIRRSSLPLLGLLDTRYSRVDAEYTLRITSGRGNLAWYTGKVWARIINPSSQGVTKRKSQEIEVERLNATYTLLNNGKPVIDQYNEKLFARLKPFAGPLKKIFADKNAGLDRKTPNFREQLKESEIFLEKINKRLTGTFL